MAVREIHSVCCFCGEHVDPKDEEAAEIVFTHPWPHVKGSLPTAFHVHRKPCFEGVMHVDMRELLGAEN